MANEQLNFTTPVGRLIMGSCTKAQDKDADGKPLLIKSGPNQGKPTQKFFIAVAIPKNPGESHWAQTEWGAKIWAKGHADAPGIAQNPAFAWKVQDGDSQVPNKKGHKLADSEGAAGCWIVFLSTSLPISTYDSKGTPASLGTAIKRGDYVQVAVTCAYNQSSQNPGIYLNPTMVALAGYGKEIVSGPDPTAAGFGVGVVLPPGASATPIGGMPTGAAPPPPTGAAPPPPAASAPTAPYVPPAAAGAPPPPAPAPNPAILGAAPLPPAGPVLTAKAGTFTLQQLVGAGWTMDTLTANGYLA